MIIRILHFIWKRLPVSVRWWLLWVRNTKFLVGVTGVVLDEQGHVLLMRHRFWDHRVWGLPGGAMLNHETCEQALARELYEETRLRLEDVRVVGVESGKSRRLAVELSARVRREGQQMKLDPLEILEAEFFPVSSLPEGVLPVHRALIERVVQA